MKVIILTSSGIFIFFSLKAFKIPEAIASDEIKKALGNLEFFKNLIMLLYPDFEFISHSTIYFSLKRLCPSKKLLKYTYLESISHSFVLPKVYLLPIKPISLCPLSKKCFKAILTPN